MNYQQDILILDDEEGFRKEIGEYLSGKKMRIHSAGLPSEAIDLLDKNNIDIAVFDIRLPEMSGLTLLKKVKVSHPDVEVIMMTGYGEMDSVIEALRFGAADYINKPFKLNEIREAIERVSKYQSVKKGRAAQSIVNNDLLNNKLQLIGKSSVMQQINGMIKKIAKTDDTTVLISGESGTGKELVARAIYALGNRKNNRFIPVNCSSIPEELFENEFFGHVKGSYTDARQDQKGLFEIADKGVLFLDEIGDMKLSMQAKLLRVIEDKKISRIGRFDEKNVDVKIITATNQDLEKMVEEKRFRADLYHRLNLIRVDIPPLRQRKEDIPLLFNYFIDDFISKYNQPIKKIEKSIIPKLMGYDFPGNVRELKNLIERAVILCDEKVLTEKRFLGLDMTSKISDNPITEPGQIFNLDKLERQSILKALKLTGNNKSKAAQMLNISRQALDRKLKKLRDC